MVAALPVPPQKLRIWVGPFSDAGVFIQSGEEMAADIVRLCALSPDAHMLEVGCGCGRLSRAFAAYLSSKGCYEGFDVSRPLIDWCERKLQPLLPNFHFSHVDVQAGGHNPQGQVSGSAFRFSFADGLFDVAIVSSVFTHMLPEEIENYASEISRVLKPQGNCFMSVFLFDGEAEMAVAKGTTIFDFRHAIGPCLTFDRQQPSQGIACRKQWFVDLLDRSGFQISAVRLGNWRKVRSHKVEQDYVIARKRVSRAV